MLLLLVVFAGISTACLLALALCIALMQNQGNPTMYAASRGSYLTVAQKSLLALAGLGFITCMYTGAYAMLFWMPDNWGSFGDDGEFQTVRAGLAGTFAAIGGMFFLQALLANFGNGAEREVLLIRSEGLEHIIDANNNKFTLERLKRDFEEKAAEARKNSALITNPDQRNGARNLHDQKYVEYRHLLEVISQVQLRE